MSWSCDLDGPKVYSEGEVTARKEHPCVECSAPILKGEKHLSYSGLWDGSWSSGRQHLLCRDACVWIRDALEGECIPFGALKEWWSEHGSSADLYVWAPRKSTEEEKKRIRANWRLGARMYAMVRRRELAARAGEVRE